MDKVEEKSIFRTKLNRFSAFFLRIRNRVRNILRKTLLILALISIVSLISEYGFYLSKDVIDLNRILQKIILYGFLIHTITKISLFINDLKFIKSHLGEIIIAVLITLHLSLPNTIQNFLRYFAPFLSTESITNFYLVITQILVIFNLIIGGVKYSQKIMLLNIQPITLMVISFAIIILFGTFLLLLPKSTTNGISFIDALFTSTSAVCVTGLIVVDTANAFTTLGKTIILFLIQIGGLGIMTLTTFIAFLMGSSGRLKEYSAIQTLLGEENLGRIRNTIFIIGISTFAIEAIGAFSIYEFIDASFFRNEGERIYFALFHSISAFCNAGFSIDSQGLLNPNLKFNSGLLLTVGSLIVLGGLGFPVISNLGKKFSLARFKDKRLRTLSIHSKLVLITSGILILVGTFFFFILEYERTLQNFSIPYKFLVALFHSISARTAGFNTVDMGSMATSTMFIMVILMWIGASPGSTGGGIKTTTFAVSFINIFSIASGRERAEMFKRQISEISVIKAFSTVILSVSFIAFTIFILLLTEPFKFEDLLFEVVSAVSTVGLTRGITNLLSDPGKIVIILSMFFGRIGLLSIFLILIKRKPRGKYDYAKEDIMII